MGQNPRSWVTDMLSIVLLVLVVCYCLKLAAMYLREALPVLVPVVVIAVIAIGIWHWYQRARW
jgi:hypothetical protein